MKSTPLMQADESAVFFTIVSAETTAEQICKRLGSQCDLTIVKGMRHTSGKPKQHPLHMAIFHSRISHSLPMEQHVQDILTRICPLNAKIKRLPSNCIPSLSFNYRLRKDGGWNFAPSTLLKLAKLAVPCTFSLQVGQAMSIDRTKKRRRSSQNSF